MITDPDKARTIIWGEGCIARILVENSGLSVKQESMMAGTKERRHRHESVQQLVYILNGEAEFELEKSCYKLTAGKFIAVAAGTAHQIRNNTLSELTFLVISSPAVGNDRINL